MTPLSVVGLLLSLVGLALSVRTVFRIVTRDGGLAEALDILADQLIALVVAVGGMALVLIGRFA